MLERREDPAERAMMAAGLELAREAARAWHGSPDGLAWHSANGVASWEVREPVRQDCQRCGTTYEAWFPGARFCSRKCISENSNAGLFDTPAKCLVCGGDYMMHRYKRGKTCSPACAGVMRRESGVLKRSRYNLAALA